MAVYSISKREYEKKKTDFRFAVKYYGKNKELLFMQKPVLNPILDNILKYLESAINEVSYLIKTVDEFCADYKTVDLDYNCVVDTSRTTVEKCAELIRETIKNIYNNDSTLLQEILLEAKTGVMGILCNSNRIYNKINNMKTTT